MRIGISTAITSFNYASAATAPLEPDQEIVALFENGEVGAWYDPSDSTTVFQDAAGRTPATVGDPVGLILDKSKGLTLGAEAVTNGTFDTDTDWNKGPGWSISGGVASFATTGGTSNLDQICLVIGKTYQISWDQTTASGVMVVFAGVSSPVSSFGGTQRYTIRVEAKGNTRLYFQAQPTFSGSIDNVTVKELPGNHATQTISSARPILQQSGATASGFGSELNTTTFPYSYTNYTGYITLGVKSVGRWYRYEFTLSSVTSGGVSIHPERAGLYDSASGTYSHNVYSTATTLRFYANNFTGTVDSVSVREITSWSGGLRYLDFDGVDDVMNVPEIQLGHTSMFALGVKQIGSSGIGWMPIGGGDTNLGADYSSYVWSYTAANSVNIRLTSAAFGLDITSSEAPFEDLDDHVFVVNRTSSSNISANLDGALLGSTTSSSSNNFPVRNFGATYHPSYYEPGRIYGVVIRNALTSAGEISDLESWLATKSGVTLSAGGGDGGDGDKGG